MKLSQLLLCNVHKKKINKIETLKNEHYKHFKILVLIIVLTACGTNKKTGQSNDMEQSNYKVRTIEKSRHDSLEYNRNQGARRSLDEKLFSVYKHKFDSIQKLNNKK